MKLSVRSLLVASATILANGSLSANVLNDPSFEGFDGTAFGDAWTSFGNAFNESNGTPTPLDGTGVAKMFGNFTGAANFSGIFQDHPAAPGEVWESSVFGMSFSGDAMNDPNRAVVKLEFRDSTAGDAIVGGGEFESSFAIDGMTGQDDWILMTTGQQTAPAGTDFVRFVIVFIQPADTFEGGAAFFDSADLSVVVPEPGTWGAILGGLALLGVMMRRRSRHS